MNYKITLRCILPLFFLFVIACAEPEKPVTKEEAAVVAASLTDAGARRNAGGFNELLDLDAFTERMVDYAHNSLDRTMVAGAMKGMKSGVFGNQIITFLGADGTYELVKQYEKDNHQHLVFRLYNEQLNYHDFELIKKGDQVKIADIFIYITGENLSSTLAASLQSWDEQGNAGKTSGKNDLKKIQLIRKYINAKEFEKADQVFKKLPAATREQKLCKMLYISIAGGLGNDTYLAALNRFQQEYPDAPNMYLLLVDAYFLRKDFAGALRCVNSLDSLINKDPFLDYYRALICKENKDTLNRLVYLERLHQHLPGFGSGTLELINAYLEGEQWDKALPLTQQYTKSKSADTVTLEYLYQVYPGFRERMEAATGKR